MYRLAFCIVIFCVFLCSVVKETTAHLFAFLNKDSQTNFSFAIVVISSYTEWINATNLCCSNYFYFLMKSEWNVYKKPSITYGKKNIASPFLQDLYYVVSKGKAVFFVAVEYGLGHYHIFTASEKHNKKLSKKIDIALLNH